MLSPRDVADLDLTFLTMTADAWDKLANSAQESESQFRSRVLGWLDNGNWRGRDAESCLTMLRFFASDLVGVRAEASAGSSILREAHGLLLKAKNDMYALYEEARLANCTINADGSVQATVGLAGPDLDLANGKVKGIADRVAAICQAATDADGFADLDLRANTDAGPDQDFNTHALGADPVGDAIRVRDMLLHVEDLEPGELYEVRTLLAQNANNPVFAERLTRDLGPAGLVDQAGNLAQFYARPGNNKGAKGDNIKQIQALLGVTLGTASPMLAKDPAWMNDLKLACEAMQPVGNSKGYPGQPLMYGYQPFAALLGNGTYDAAFLNTVGTNMLDFEKKAGKPSPWEMSMIPRPNFPFDLNNGTPGYDPVVGLMSAFSRNPAASTTFLDPGVPPTNQNLQYLTEQRSWLPGYDGAGTKTTLGAAIEAASTGHPSNGQPGIPPQPNVPHSDAQKRVMNETISVLGGQTHLKGDFPPEMRVSVGNMVADYIPDGLQKNLSMPQIPPNPQDSWDRALMNTLTGVAYNPEAFGTVAAAEIVETQTVLSDPANRPEKGQNSNVVILPDNVKEAIAANGTIAGIRNEAILKQTTAEIDQATWDMRYENHAAAAVTNRLLPKIAPELNRVIDIFEFHQLDDTKAGINANAADQQVDNYWTMRAPAQNLMYQYAQANGVQFDDIDQAFASAFDAGTISPGLRS